MIILRKFIWCRPCAIMKSMGYRKSALVDTELGNWEMWARTRSVWIDKLKGLMIGKVMGEIRPLKYVTTKSTTTWRSLQTTIVGEDGLRTVARGELSSDGWTSGIR